MMLEMASAHKEYEYIQPALIHDLYNHIKSCVEINDDCAVWKNSDALTGKKGAPSIETTAYAIIGLSKAQYHGISCATMIEQGINFIMSKRGSNGWSSTRDTLYASIAISKAGSNIAPDFTLNINVNGKNVHAYKVDASNVDFKIYDLQQIFVDDLCTGTNHIKIEMNGVGLLPISSELKKWRAVGYGSHETDMAKIETILNGDDELTLKIVFL